MKMDIKKMLPIAALTLLGIASSAQAARAGNKCAPEPGAKCYADDCCRTYCLGPDNYGANAPVKPRTCNGDVSITVAGFYWNAHQDGMEYAIEDEVAVPDNADTAELNNLINADYLTPSNKWNFGFKAGLSYTSPCDGWDIGVLWTWYKGKASSHVEAEADDNTALVALWSAFSPASGGITYATDITTDWNLDLNLVDIELGREFWTSRYLSMRPFVGIRVAYLYQEYDINHKGGSFSAQPGQAVPFNNEVDLNNNFKGAGLRAGLDTNWNFGCGWSIYGNFAFSLVYGRFTFDHDEVNREANISHTKTDIMDAENTFHASRGMMDLALGLQYTTLFCECNYALTVQLGWEHHLFLDQNQMWRVVRIGDGNNGGLPNNLGENVFHERRGDLDTQGFTLTFRFDF